MSSFCEQQMPLTLQNFNRLIHYYEPEGVVFLNNAKSGCSSIKAALLKAIYAREGKALPDPVSPKFVHGQNDAWSASFNNIGKSRFRFSVVRNPFSRILSAYLDKIARGGILCNQFNYAHNFPIDYRAGFDEFLEKLDLSKNLFDQHWRPQTANLLLGYLRVDEVYFLESLTDSHEELERSVGFGFEIGMGRKSHATGASKRIKDYYSESAIQRVVEIYKSDFETFGYSLDIDCVNEAPSTKSIQVEVESPKIASLLEFSGFVNSGAEVVSDSFYSGANEWSFSKCAIASRLPALRRFLPDGFEQEVKKRVQEKNVARRVEALQAAINLGSKCVTKDEMSSYLQSLCQHAPFDIGNHSRHINFLINKKDFVGAERQLRFLEKMTWNKNMVALLSDRLSSERD